MKRQHIPQAALMLLLSSTAAVNAQENEDLYLIYGDADMVSIATGMSQPINKAPSTATVITARDIKAMGAITLDEVLESVPGLHVIPSSLDRMNPVYTIRGIYTGFNPQVLFLVNGQRLVSSLFNGGISSNSRMNVQNISRIEIIRGPGSAVYGADAFAGVINIVTKNASELDGVHAGVRAGSFNTRDIWLQYGGDLADNWQLAFNLEHATQDADKSRVVSSDYQSVFDANYSTNASLTPTYLDQRYKATTYNLHLNNNYWDFGVDGWIQEDRGLGAGSAQAIDHKGYDDFNHYLVSAGYLNKDIKDWELKARVNRQVADLDAHFNIFPAGARLPIGSDGNVDNPFAPVNPPVNPVLFPDGLIGNPGGKSITSSLNLVGIFDGWDHHSLRMEAGAREEKIDTTEKKNFGPGVIDGTVPVVNGDLTSVTDTSYIFAENRSRNIKYLSLQDVWDFLPDWNLTAGVRYDNYSDFGDTTNPRAALVWNTTQNITSKLLYGRAFRAPSFSELYSQNNPVVLGNPNLKPETIDTTELSFNYDIVDIYSLTLSMYKFRTEDMIDFVPNADGSNTAQNAKSLDGQGFELEASWHISKQLKLLANYAQQNTENRAASQQEPVVPEQQFYLDLRYKLLPNWLFSTQANWVSKRDRFNILANAREKVDGYTLVNMTLRRKQLFDHWEFAFSVKNVFDETAYEPSDGRISDNYPLNERSVYAELRYKM